MTRLSPCQYITPFIFLSVDPCNNLKQLRKDIVQIAMYEDVRKAV